MSTPQRTQYPYAALTNEQQLRLLGLNAPLIKRIQIQGQWDTFERVENYNDLIYQKFASGYRGDTYYQFKSNQEYNDYNSGQRLHILAYPNLPISTFQSIQDRPFPEVSTIFGSLPQETNVPRFLLNKPVPTASEQAALRAEMEIYAYVSTFNGTHTLKYTFVDDVEKNAYERVELLMNAIPTRPPPN